MKKIIASGLTSEMSAPGVRWWKIICDLVG